MSQLPHDQWDRQSGQLPMIAILKDLLKTCNYCSETLVNVVFTMSELAIVEEARGIHVLYIGTGSLQGESD